MNQNKRIARELQAASKGLRQNSRYLNNPVIKADMIETIALLQAEKETDPHRVWNYQPRKPKPVV